MHNDHDHETIRHGDRAPACNMVIFGGGGDLTKRLLMPALYNLSRTGLLPEHFSLIGVDRLELTNEAFRLQIEEALRAFGNDKHYAQKLDEHHLQNLLSRITYLQGDFSDPACYARLNDRLQSNAAAEATGENVVFYLAVAARFFAGIVDQLGASGLVTEGPNRWRRVVVEKPFGHDVESAKALNSQLRKSVAERQIYRMDHFLGKETVQNIMLMRFANGIFEPLWNREHIDHVQITVAETVGVERHIGFFEDGGGDSVVANHDHGV